MLQYRAPLRDLRFVYTELHKGKELQKLPGYEDASIDLVDNILVEAARFCEKELSALNGVGRVDGCSFHHGVVRTPAGFKKAYQAFVDGGWNAISCDRADGGHGLPHAVKVQLEEIISSSNFAFSIYPCLTHAAYAALTRFGNEILKETYSSKLAAGIWSATMCLTEPQCGTDLRLCRTKAVPMPGNAHRLSGAKIFISAGEHDLTENIVHMVLARVPGAPPGIRGLSLFLVPKFLPDAMGRVGPRNGVKCNGIEDKMGLEQSPTCVIDFDNATGFLVGDLNRGMRATLTMLNTARLTVGAQALGICEVAYQRSAQYAKTRRQGRSPSGPRQPDETADPIIVHPDVRRMLLTMRSYTEGSRALALWVAMAQDRRARHPEPAVRSESSDLVDLLIPVIKALLSDLSFEVATLGVQIFGGHGYIRENGMERLLRDARVTQIYEGTNGIQGLDLLRNVISRNGRQPRRFFGLVREIIEGSQPHARLGEFVLPLTKAFIRLQQATEFIKERSRTDPEEGAAAATEYLRLFGLVALGYMWVRMAAVALEKESAEESEFYSSKLATARFFMQRLLPQTGSLLESIVSGKRAIMALDESAF